MVNNVFLKFQPTPLVWGRQNYAKSLQVDYLFQLMPPCVGGDVVFHDGGLLPINFNPRPPCGGGDRLQQERVHDLDISTPAPAREATF